MKRRRWLKFGILGGVGALLVGGLAFAKGGRGHCAWGGGPGGWSIEEKKKFASARIDEVLDDLEVTDEQRAAIHASRDKLFASLEDAKIGQGREEKFAKVTELFQQDELDLREIEAVKSEHREKLEKVQEAVTQALVEVHATLTPEQRKQLVEKAERFHRWKGR